MHLFPVNWLVVFIYSVAVYCRHIHHVMDTFDIKTQQTKYHIEYLYNLFDTTKRRKRRTI